MVQVVTLGPLQGIALVLAYVQGKEVLPALPKTSPPGTLIILLLPLKTWCCSGPLPLALSSSTPEHELPKSGAPQNSQTAS